MKLSDEAIENLSDALNECEYIDDIADEIFELLGSEPSMVDECIDDGCDDDEDEYVMKRVLEAGGCTIRVYYGNNTGKVGYVNVTQD